MAKYAVVIQDYMGAIDVHIVDGDDLIPFINAVYETDRFKELDDYELDDLYDMNQSLDNLVGVDRIIDITNVDTRMCLFSMN